MSSPVNIETQRLLLRPPTVADAPRICALAGDYDIARMTAVIPHPYTEQMAADWLTQVEAGEEGVVFVIEREGAVIGCTGYRAFDAAHAELGYWIGKPYWGEGYATEAVRAVIAQGFDEHGFAYLKAGHFADNPASRAVLGKLGFSLHGEEMRDCLARGQAVRCFVYRLDRECALGPLRAPSHAGPKRR